MEKYLGIVNESDLEKLKENQEVFIKNIKEKDFYGKTFLHYICESRKEKNHQEILRCLLEYKSSPNQKDNLGNTPMHYLCKNENVDFEKLGLFCEYRADLNTYNYGEKNSDTNYDKNTPFHYACSNPKITPAIIRLLLEYGANPWIYNNNESNFDLVQYSFVEVNEVYGMNGIDYAKNNDAIKNVILFSFSFSISILFLAKQKKIVSIWKIFFFFIQNIFQFMKFFILFIFPYFLTPFFI